MIDMLEKITKKATFIIQRKINKIDTPRRRYKWVDYIKCRSVLEAVQLTDQIYQGEPPELRGYSTRLISRLVVEQTLDIHEDDMDFIGQQLDIPSFHD